MIFLQNVNVEFGYRQAFSSTFKALRNRNATGQTLGQIGSKFGSKLSNATRGKLSSIKRGFNRVGRAFSGGNTNQNNPVKLNQKQQNRATANIKKAGGIKSTGTIGKTKTFGNQKF